MNVAGYSTDELIYQSDRSLVYRAHREKTGESCILKTSSEKLSPDLARMLFQSEYAIGSSLDSEAHVRYLEYQEHDGQPCLLIEDFDAISLSRLIPEKGFDIENFLQLAVKITNALAQLHQKKIIHKDLCPSNIAVNPKTGTLKLIDFGSASNFIKEVSHQNSALNHASLAYISPEQTGRMNRLVTYKTDFYSLGVTFFQMLTGRLPYPASDSSELIYNHIAAETPAAKQVNPSIPAQLSEMIAKLMSKNPEERYHSALGLLNDLEKCLAFWNKNKAIPLFPLGENDISEVFNIPEKLYGRDKELAKVKGYFQRAVKGGFTVCYITGQSGFGKSAFVSELYKDIAREKGYFGSGKFDQFQRNVPYSALIQALSQIIRSILTESPESISRWKTLLEENLGNNAGLLASVLPDLELIMGKLESVEITNPEQARNRFILAFRNLIRTFSRQESPLVLFMDDLQWIDAATLQLFSDYFNSIEAGEKYYTMIIGAYRDNEVTEEHPLSMVFRDFEQRGYPSRIIAMPPLDVEAINELCADALETSPENCRQLANLLHTKTGGNPFFVRQFLETLYEKGLIFLNHETRSWDWRLESIREAGFTDNVLDLIQAKIHNLNPDVQMVLKIASCLGIHFEAADITEIAAIEKSRLNRLLGVAMQEDIIYKLYSETEELFRFQHDRIQNAAYNLIHPDELNPLHLQIGTYLIGKPEVHEQNTEALFEVLQHLNRTEALITDPGLRLKLARYNLEAGRKAKISNAYQAALGFVHSGIAFLPANAWQAQFDLARELHLIGVQSAYLTGEFETMHQLADLAMEHTSDPVEKVAFHEIITYSYASRRDWNNAVNEAIEALRILGIKLPKNPGLLHVLKHLGRFFFALGRRKPEDLIDLPDLQNPRIEWALKIFISATSAAYLTSPNMFAIFFIEMARLSATYGNCKYSSFGYVGFGVFYGGALGFIDYGFRFGELGKKVFEKYHSDELMAKVYFSLYAFLQNWKVDVKKLYPKLMEAFQVGSQVGENEYAAWCQGIRGGMSTLSGEPLAKVEEDLLASIKYARNLKQIEIISKNFHHYASWWLDKNPEGTDPLAEGYVDEMGPVFEEEKFFTALAEHDLMFGSIYLHYFRYEKAWEHLSRGWLYHQSLVGLFYYAQLAFYRAWCALKLQQEKPGFFKKSELKTILKDFTKWGVHSPPNHGHKLTMFDAELAVLKGDKAEAMELFDQAIQQAKQSDHPNDEAAFCEMTARHYRRWGKEEFAELYLQKAYSAYQRWGALRKMRTLTEEYPELFRTYSSFDDPEAGSSSITSGEISQTLDIRSIIKASQAISGEIQIEALLTRLLKVLTESAGAQRVIILLNRKGKLQVEALKTIDSPVEIRRTPLEQFAEIPASIIHYIEKTRSMVLLENAATEGAFTRDPFIVKSRQKSILGIPIIRQGDLQGIIYLDNRLMAGVFTPERADILKTLSTQVAISLENANYISEMQELNRSYDRFVPKEFLRLLGKDSIMEVRLGDQQVRQMNILFADIRNFTSLSESIPADETFSLMNDYLTTVTMAIHDNGGIIDKFIGDGIMALFPDEADNALQAAVQMQRRLKDFNAKRLQAGEKPIQIGVGLHIGNVILGTVGTEKRLSTTVIGDPVNLAARLEETTKTNRAGILVSAELVAKLGYPENFNLRPVGFLKVKGKSNKIKVVEEYSAYDEKVAAKIQQYLPLFEEAIEQLDNGHPQAAATRLCEYLEKNPDDKVARQFNDHCSELLNNE